MARETLDAIVVLAGGIDKQGSIPAQVELRLDKGVELYKQGVAPVIIVSGKWSLYYDFKPPITEAESMKRYLLKKGIPGSVIIKEESSQNTIGNAFFIKTKIYAAKKWKSAVVVTSDMHVPRSKYIFEMVFGPEYALRFESSPSGLSNAEYALAQDQHAKSFERIKQQFAGCAPGRCDDLIVTKLLDKNAYEETKKVLPKKFISEGKFE